MRVAARKGSSRNNLPRKAVGIVFACIGVRVHVGLGGLHALASIDLTLLAPALPKFLLIALLVRGASGLAVNAASALFTQLFAL